MCFFNVSEKRGEKKASYKNEIKSTYETSWNIFNSNVNTERQERGEKKEKNLRAYVEVFFVERRKKQKRKFAAPQRR